MVFCRSRTSCPFLRHQYQYHSFGDFLFELPGILNLRCPSQAATSGAHVTTRVLLGKPKCGWCYNLTSPPPSPLTAAAPTTQQQYRQLQLLIITPPILILERQSIRGSNEPALDVVYALAAIISPQCRCGPRSVDDPTRQPPPTDRHDQLLHVFVTTAFPERTPPFLSSND